MNHAMCIVCTEPKHFHSLVYDAQRIKLELKRYAKRQGFSERREHTDRELWNRLRFDKRHTYFMCGVCHQVNTMELEKEESELREIVYDICKELEAGADLPYHYILQSLQGYYPVMWQCVERSVRKRKLFA